MQKPEPLGTEFKNLVDAYCGQMMELEVMEGKERMRKTEYTSEFGVTVGCVMRVNPDCSLVTHVFGL